jgi:Exosome complex component RRP40, S1 domain
LVYARVSLAHKDMEPELECFDAQSRKSEGFGELKGGFMATCSLGMCRLYAFRTLFRDLTMSWSTTLSTDCSTRDIFYSPSSARVFRWKSRLGRTVVFGYKLWRLSRLLPWLDVSKLRTLTEGGWTKVRSRRSCKLSTFDHAMSHIVPTTICRFVNQLYLRASSEKYVMYNVIQLKCF